MVSQERTPEGCQVKVGDSVMLTGALAGQWIRIGLVLGYSRGMVLVFWGEDFPYEEEYPEQIQVV